MARFRHKALAAALAAIGGALGANRIYLGQRLWSLPLLIGVVNWYQTPAFFVAMGPVIAGFVQALITALMPDAAFDARFNAHTARRNRSGWAAVLVAVASLALGAIVLLTTIALLFYATYDTPIAR